MRGRSRKGPPLHCRRPVGAVARRSSWPRSTAAATSAAPTAGGRRGGGASAHRDGGQQAHGVIVALGAVGGGIGIGHGPREFEGVATLAAAEVISGHVFRIVRFSRFERGENPHALVLNVLYGERWWGVRGEGSRERGPGAAGVGWGCSGLVERGGGRVRQGGGCAGWAGCGWFSPFPGRVMVAVFAARVKAMVCAVVAGLVALTRFASTAEWAASGKRGRCGQGAGPFGPPGGRWAAGCLPACLACLVARVPVGVGGATKCPDQVLDRGGGRPTGPAALCRACFVRDLAPRVTESDFRDPGSKIDFVPVLRVARNRVFGCGAPQVLGAPPRTLPHSWG